MTLQALQPLEPLMDKCVHCGFCLPTCPSYLLLGQEMDSPRGRIYMMKAGVEDRMALTPSVVQHFDTCLGCMACETACPSGVRYAPLIEATRATIERDHQRPPVERLFRAMLFRVLPYPRRLRVLSLPIALAPLLRRSGLAAQLPPRLRALVNLAPRVTAASRGVVPEHTSAQGDIRRRVGVITGCVQSVFFGDVNQATVRVLAAEGCDVIAPASQGCCGALALHGGRDEEARAFARALIPVFERANVDEIVVNAAGCGSTLKEYGHLLAGDPVWAERARQFAAKVRDVTETLTELGPSRATRHPIATRAAYHDACHLAHAQGVRQPPRDLLAAIPGLTLVPLAENDICCGSAGIFNLVQPELAADLGRRKATHIAASGAEVVVTSNPGCILQIRSATEGADPDGRRRVFHVVEVLDASIRGATLPA